MNGRGWMIGLALLLAATAVRAAPVEETVKRVQARYDATADFTAVVHQELVMVSAGKTLTAEGAVAYKRPGRMRWEFQDPERKVIVADGTTLWYYQPEEKQVLKSPFQAAFRSTAPISFLIGVGRIAEDFHATLESAEPGRIVLSLVPKQSNADVGRLRLMVDPVSFDIIGAEVPDPIGNITRLRFTDLRRNAGVDDSLFHLEIPRGVDVIEAPIGY